MIDINLPKDIKPWYGLMLYFFKDNVKQCKVFM